MLCIWCVRSDTALIWLQDGEETDGDDVFSAFSEADVSMEEPTMRTVVDALAESLRFRPQTLIQKRRFLKEEPMSSGAIDDQQSIFGMLISLLSFTHHPRASPLSSPSPLPTSSFL